MKFMKKASAHTGRSARANARMGHYRKDLLVRRSNVRTEDLARVIVVLLTCTSIRLSASWRPAGIARLQSVVTREGSVGGESCVCCPDETVCYCKLPGRWGTSPCCPCKPGGIGSRFSMLANRRQIKLCHSRTKLRRPLTASVTSCLRFWKRPTLI